MLSLAAWGTVTGVSAGLLAAGVYNEQERELSSDGDRYWSMGEGKRVPYPFAFRWLVPLLCGNSWVRWRACTYLHLLALPVLTAVWLRPQVPREGLAVLGGLMMCGLPGLWRNHLRRPVLVDPVALVWAIGAAILIQYELWLPAVLVVIVAAGAKETAPVFAACFAWHPLPLVGLVVPLVRRLLIAPGADTHHSRALAEPFAAARDSHAGRMLAATTMLAPWGMGLLAVLNRDTRTVAMLVVVLALAYGQLIVAVNHTRLYQWAAPVVLLAAVAHVPDGYEAAVLAAHVFNPWAGDGR